MGILHSTVKLEWCLRPHEDMRELLALEQGVRTNLAAIGIDVTTELLEKDALNAAMQAGDFNL